MNLVSYLDWTVKVEICLFLLSTNAISNKHIYGYRMLEVVEFGPDALVLKWYVIILLK